MNEFTQQPGVNDAKLTDWSNAPDIRDLKEPLKVVWGDQLKQSCNIPITEFDSVVKKKNSQLDILNVECH